MLGNVSEMTMPSAAERVAFRDADPTGEEPAFAWMGGSFCLHPDSARATRRELVAADYRNQDLGVRLARPVR